VRQLNQQLTDIHFGSIHGIRIDLAPDRSHCSRSYTRCAKARRKNLLFSAALPIEEALDAIFKRYGGGGRSGGQRLLDYREYHRARGRSAPASIGCVGTCESDAAVYGEAIGGGCCADDGRTDAVGMGRQPAATARCVGQFYGFCF